MENNANDELRYVLSSYAIEKLIPSDSAQRDIKEIASGKKDPDAAVESLLLRYGVKDVKKRA